VAVSHAVVRSLMPTFDLGEAGLAEHSHEVLDVAPHIKVRNFGRVTRLLASWTWTLLAESLRRCCPYREEKGVLTTAPDCESRNRAWLEDSIRFFDLVRWVVNELEDEV